MTPDLVIDGAALVLRGAYTATMPIRVGDALKISGEWKVAPTEASDEDSIGTAHHSAAQGADVDVVILGLARVVTTTGTTRGDVVVPADGDRGKGRRADKASDVLAGKVRRYGVATETKPAGKPSWVHLRSG